MALTESYMLPLGTALPDFSLENPLSQNTTSLHKNTGEKGTLIIFMCNHCPYVVHLIDHLTAFTAKIKSEGINSIAISSNDAVAYPQDGPEKMALYAKEKGFSFPYLYDPTQKAAQAFEAACTPDFYLFDEDKKLVYRGRYDASRPGNDLPITGEDLSKAIDAMQKKTPIPGMQYPSLGCNIKWISGNEPENFFI